MFIKMNTEIAEQVKAVEYFPEEEVMLSLRIRSLENMSRANIARVVLMGGPVRLLIFLALQPVSIFNKPKNFVLSLCALVGALWIVDLTFFQSLLAAFLVLVVLNAKVWGQRLACVLADLIDLFFLGLFTRSMVAFYNSVSSQRTFLKDHEHPYLYTYMYSSRQVWPSTVRLKQLQFEEDQFFSKTQELGQDREAIQVLCEEYWQEI